jgi:hypothetical protein
VAPIETQNAAAITTMAATNSLPLRLTGKLSRSRGRLKVPIS